MSSYRRPLGELYDKIAGDWLSLEAKWRKVVGSETVLGCRSGGWHVRKEYSGEGLAPMADEPDEVAIYIEHRHEYHREVGRWSLDELDSTGKDDE